MPRTVYIIRHGQTLLNKQDKIRSWLNIPLDEQGFAEARKLGWQLHEQGIPIDGLFSSDLLRSEQTTIEVAKMAGYPILGTTIGLRPWNVGSLAGSDGAKAHKIMMAHAKDEPDKVIGGDGESFNIFKYRVLTCVIGLLNTYPGKTLGLVSHSRGERILHAWAAGGSCESLGIDLDVFGERGEATASASKVAIKCSLVTGGDDAPSAGAANDEESPPIAGARRASDRNWYINDPSRPGKYLRVRRGRAAA